MRVIIGLLIFALGLMSRAAVAQDAEPTASSKSSPAADWHCTTNPYLCALYALIMRQQHYPEVARANHIKGKAVVAFWLDEHGNLVRHKLFKSSGHTELDGEAVAAIKRAAPFPPPPTGAPHGFVAQMEFPPASRAPDRQGALDAQLAAESLHAAAIAQSADGNQAIPESYRAALLVEAPEKPSKYKTYEGSVVWRPDGNPLGTAVHAEIDVPSKLKVGFTLKKNTDPNMPASHIITIDFGVQSASGIGGIKQIGVPQLRQENMPRGDPLTGVPGSNCRKFVSCWFEPWKRRTDQSQIAEDSDLDRYSDPSE
jgi:TonB family protein